MHPEQLKGKGGTSGGGGGREEWGGGGTSLPVKRIVVKSEGKSIRY